MSGKEMAWENSERENVIYGAGVFGRRLWKFLKDLEVPVHLFCQTETGGSPKEYKGILIISLVELKNRCTNKNILIF